MSDRFPDIADDGLQIAASALPSGGRAGQFVWTKDPDGVWRARLVEWDASGGVWQAPGVLLFVRNKPGDPKDGAILRWDGTSITEVLPPGVEGWTCHNGHLAVWTRSSDRKAVTTSRAGHLAWIEGITDRVNVLKVDGEEITRGDLSEPRYTGEALVWIDRASGVRRVFGRRSHGAPTDPLSALGGDEFWPQAVETSRGLYVLTHGHPERGRPLFLRPWGQTRGHIVATGLTDRPDVRAIGTDAVLVAFSNLASLQRVIVDLTAPPVDPVPPAVEPVLDRASTVDVIEYLPLGVTLDGDHLYGMRILGVVDRPAAEGGPLTVYALAKHTDGGGEWWAYDNDWLYQLTDQAGSPIGEVISGVFTPRFAPNGDRIDANYLSPDARVMPRRIRTGMPALPVVTNLFHIAEPGQHPTAWRYTNTFEVYTAWPTPHGPLPAIRLKTDPRTTRDPNGRLRGGYEYGTYCRSVDKATWYVTWEQWRTRDDNSGDEVMTNPEDGKPLFRTFDRVVTTPIQWKPSRRPDGAPLRPSEGGQVGVTFQEPAFPLTVRIGDKTRFVLKRDGEWPSRVRWWRRYGDGAVDRTDWRNPQEDADHTWEWTREGQATAGIEWDGGGTGARREVHVTKATGGGGGGGGGGSTIAEVEVSDFLDRLEASYGIDPDRHGALPTRVDPGGRVTWTYQYINRRSKGLPHEAAVREVENEIDKAEGRAPRWGGGPVDPRPGPGPSPGPSPSQRPAGRLGVEGGGGFHIGGTPWLPAWWHDGSLFSVFCQNEGEALRTLDLGMEAEWDGERTWITLDGDWWSGLHVGPRQTADYYGRFGRYLAAHKERNLHLFLSHGSMFPDSIPDDHLMTHFAILGDVIAGIGVETVDVAEWCNEVWGACPDDRRDPGLMHACMDVLEAHCPGLVQAGSAWSGMPQPVEILNQWSRTVYLQHSFRGFRWFNKLEHAFSTPYEDRPSRRVGINSEPPARNTSQLLRAQERAVVERNARTGVERWVSATENHQECGTEFQVLLACIDWISRQGHVLFSSPGVRPDPQERIDQIAGWREVPQARKWLPPDVMRYSEIFHGGAGREFSPRRVIDAGPGRAEHAYHQPDGRVVVVEYHKPASAFIRAMARVDRIEPVGDWGRVIVGQAA